MRKGKSNLHAFSCYHETNSPSPYNSQTNTFHKGNKTNSQKLIQCKTRNRKHENVMSYLSMNNAFCCQTSLRNKDIILIPFFRVYHKYSLKENRNNIILQRSIRSGVILNMYILLPSSLFQVAHLLVIQNMVYASFKQTELGGKGNKLRKALKHLV